VDAAERLKRVLAKFEVKLIAGVTIDDWRAGPGTLCPIRDIAKEAFPEAARTTLWRAEVDLRAEDWLRTDGTTQVSSCANYFIIKRPADVQTVRTQAGHLSGSLPPGPGSMPRGRPRGKPDQGS